MRRLVVILQCRRFSSALALCSCLLSCAGTACGWPAVFQRSALLITSVRPADGRQRLDPPPCKWYHRPPRSSGTRAASCPGPAHLLRAAPEKVLVIPPPAFAVKLRPLVLFGIKRRGVDVPGCPGSPPWPGSARGATRQRIAETGQPPALEPPGRPRTLTTRQSCRGPVSAAQSDKTCGHSNIRRRFGGGIAFAGFALAGVATVASLNADVILHAPRITSDYSR